jgi:hypothetical protein
MPLSEAQSPAMPLSEAQKPCGKVSHNLGLITSQVSVMPRRVHFYLYVSIIWCTLFMERCRKTGAYDILNNN